LILIMSTLTLLPSGRTLDVAPGSLLLKALLDAGEPITVKCGGNAGCGQCHVFVNEGRKGINRTTPAENAKLDAMVGVSSRSRLACQVVIGNDPLTVELLGALSG
jgi:ferredoxin, 2Fe-2S